jgi:hypothetical protein
MKPIKLFILLALVLAPALAEAQGYYGGPGPGPYPGGFHRRMGRLAWGFSIGLGGMNDSGNSVTCDNCGYTPLAVEADFHLGGFITPRFALLFEAQVNAQQLHAADATSDDTQLEQTSLMVAAQYWLLPQLWIKGGIGFAYLHYDDTDAGFTIQADSGLALMGAIGFEVFSGRFFAFDIQGRLIDGSYSGVSDHITAGTIGIGFNWY